MQFYRDSVHQPPFGGLEPRTRAGPSACGVACLNGGIRNESFPTNSPQQLLRPTLPSAALRFLSVNPFQNSDQKLHTSSGSWDARQVGAEHACMKQQPPNSGVLTTQNNKEGSTVTEIDVYKEWLGIPEGDRPPDHYTLLRCVMFEDDIDKVRGNYRRLNNHVRVFTTGKYLKQSQNLLNELARAMLCLTDPDAKRDYDEANGRDPEDVTESEVQTTLQYLVAKGIIKRSQVTEIEHFADARGLTHRDAVVQMKLAESADATQAMAVELRMPSVDLEDMLPEDDVLDRLPKEIVKRHSCMPLFENGGRLLVACADEPTPDLEDEVRIRFGVPMRGVLAVPRSINQAIARYYAPGERSTLESPDAAAGGTKRKLEKVKSSTTTQAQSENKSGTPLSDEEKANRRNISLIVICWSLIVPLVALTLLGDGSTSMTEFAISLTIAGFTAGLLKLTYWK